MSSRNQEKKAESIQPRIWCLSERKRGRKRLFSGYSGEVAGKHTDYKVQIGFSFRQQTQIHTLLSADQRVCRRETDMWTSLRRSPIIFYFLWVTHVRVCGFARVRSRHSSSGNLRRCDLRDIGFGSFWGLRGAEVSEFQFPPNSWESHTLTLCIPLTEPNSPSYPYLDLLFILSHPAINTQFIHNVPQEEISQAKPPSPLHRTKRSLFLITSSFQEK